MMLRFAAALAVMPMMLGAQSATPAAAEPAPRISPAIGVHYGSPLRASAAVGMRIDFVGRTNDGIVATAELGQQGGQITLGYFHMFGWFGSGYSVRAAVLRTGDEPWDATEHTTYVGAELHGMLIFGVGGRVGFMRRASHSSAKPEETLVPVGISIGF